MLAGRAESCCHSPEELPRAGKVSRQLQVAVQSGRATRPNGCAHHRAPLAAFREVCPSSGFSVPQSLCWLVLRHDVADAAACPTVDLRFAALHGAVRADAATLVRVVASQVAFGRLECVVLSSCQSLGVAQLLFEAGVRYVICWRTPAESKACTAFSRHFYQSLLRAHASFDSAFLHAVERLRKCGFRLADPRLPGEVAAGACGVPYLLAHRHPTEAGSSSLAPSPALRVGLPPPGDRAEKQCTASRHGSAGSVETSCHSSTSASSVSNWSAVRPGSTSGRSSSGLIGQQQPPPFAWGASRDRRVQLARGVRSACSPEPAAGVYSPYASAATTSTVSDEDEPRVESGVHADALGSASVCAGSARSASVGRAESFADPAAHTVALPSGARAASFATSTAEAVQPGSLGIPSMAADPHSGTMARAWGASDGDEDDDIDDYDDDAASHASTSGDYALRRDSLSSSGGAVAQWRGCRSATARRVVAVETSSACLGRDGRGLPQDSPESWAHAPSLRAEPVEPGADPQGSVALATVPAALPAPADVTGWLVAVGGSNCRSMQQTCCLPVSIPAGATRVATARGNHWVSTRTPPSFQATDACVASTQPAAGCSAVVFRFFSGPAGGQQLVADQLQPKCDKLRPSTPPHAEASLLPAPAWAGGMAMGATTLPGGAAVLCVAGGARRGQRASSACALLRPGSSRESWAAGPKLATGRCHFALAGVKSLLVAIGGVVWDADGVADALDSVEALDVTSSAPKWVMWPSLRIPRSRAAHIWDPLRKHLWVLGGDGPSGASTSAEVLKVNDPGAGWTLIRDCLPRNRIASAATWIPGTRLGVISGGDRVRWLGIQSGERRSVAVLNLETAACTEKAIAPMRAERRGHALAWVSADV